MVFKKKFTALWLSIVSLLVLALSPIVGAAATTVEFNGINANGIAKDSTTLRFEQNNAFTVAFRVRVDNYSNNTLPRIFEKRSHYLSIMGNPSNSMYGHLGLEIVNSCGCGNNNPAQPGVTEYWSATKLKKGQFYRVAISFNQGKVRMVLNGAEEKVHVIYPWTGTMETTVGRDFYMASGDDPAKSRFLDGAIDDFILYNRAIADLSYLPGRAPTGAAAVWHISNDGKDSSGNNNHMTFFNTTWGTR